MGIIAGIGDKETNKNIIIPEIDAGIRKYIIGKNTIISGLNAVEEVIDLGDGEEFPTGKWTLGTGVCLLCGYYGILENSINITAKDIVSGDYIRCNYVYGKFDIHFSVTQTDSFSIHTTMEEITTNVNPTDITEAGTYYLLLYKSNALGDFVRQVDYNQDYPARAYKSDEASKLISGGTISENVTGVTPSTNDVSNKVATTEFVNNAITQKINLQATMWNCYNKNGELVIQFNLRKKIDYVVGTVAAQTGVTNVAIDMSKTAPLQENFRPPENISVCMGVGNSFVLYTISTNGQIIYSGMVSNINELQQITRFPIGYQTN